MDWNEIWIREQRLNIASGKGKGCWATWQDKPAAQRYYDRTINRRATWDRINEIATLIEPDWRVLDIGAGPGNIAIPLAEKAAHLTAVEPAEGMISVFRDNINTRSTRNIDIVEKKWDDVDVQTDLHPPYHLTISSYSLGMLDLLAAIDKMATVTTNLIMIYWHAGDQAWDREAKILWPILHHCEYIPIPKSNIVFNLLYEQGIYPDVKVYRTETSIVYPSFEDALSEYIERFETQNEQQVDALSAYLKNVLKKEENGQYVLVNHTTGMRLSWAPERR